jgi:predicted O-methyltransferase YrrM
MSESLSNDFIDVAKKLHKGIQRRVAIRHPFVTEGSSSIEEMAYLMQTVRAEKARNIVEVGFHLGHSALAFLTASPETKVTSFDIGKHYITTTKKHVDKLFPARHTLIEGDSTVTIPRYIQDNPGTTFDLMFVDGGHTYEQTLTDLQNFSQLARPYETAVIVDDLTPWHPWGKGPTRAWQHMKDDGYIEEEECWKDGQHVEKITPPGKRAWALGYYVTRVAANRKCRIS